MEAPLVMAIGDSLDKLIAARRAALTDSPASTWIARREELFAPIVRRLRAVVGGIDARFIKNRLTRDKAVIRVGNGDIDTGWDITPNPARNIDSDAPLVKVVESRNYMSEQRTNETFYFADEDSLAEYLERRIAEHTARYSTIV
jgi:hypothetical protein